MKKLLSKYKVSWLILLPIKGKSTKKDVQILNKLNPLGGFGIIGVNSFMIGRFFPDKRSAEIQLKKIKGLTKGYRAYIITDAQFGSMSIDYIKGENQLFITNKQKTASKVVK